MSIDWTNKTDIFSAIKDVEGDNKRMYSLADSIRLEIARAKKKSAKNVSNSLKGALDILSVDSSDEELRNGARAILISKLKSNEISASEFAQFKDVFGLASNADTMEVYTVSYKDQLCDGCHRINGETASGGEEKGKGL